MSAQLTVQNHNRDAMGMSYVYPVVSRRAGGVSVGINLNPNNACNWHCAYCQVPALVRGSAPEIDLDLLRDELHQLLHDIIQGDFMAKHVPEDCRILCDVAISGNGEPTSCRSFDAVVDLVLEVMAVFHLTGNIPLRLISNGSYVHKTHVQRGLHRMAENKGEVWVKVDSVTEAGIERINGVHADAALLYKQVKTVALVCPTWIQTCMLAWDGQVPTDIEVDAYLTFLKRLKDEKLPVRGVLLYGLARPSMQLEAAHVSTLGAAWMEAFKARVEAIGFAIKISL